MKVELDDFSKLCLILQVDIKSLYNELNEHRGECTPKAKRTALEILSNAAKLHALTNGGH